MTRALACTAHPIARCTRTPVYNLSYVERKIYRASWERVGGWGEENFRRAKGAIGWQRYFVSITIESGIKDRTEAGLDETRDRERVNKYSISFAEAFDTAFHFCFPHGDHESTIQMESESNENN